MNIELPISPDYVKNWGFSQAIRELLQNAIDQATVNPYNEMTVTYDPEAQVLRIANRQSTLDRSSLLLGMTTKADDTRTIGQFGEGYKLALLVLTRLDHPVRVLNYKSKEVWIPRFIQSAKLNARVLAIQITKHRFTKVPDNDLTFEVYGVIPDKWLTVQANTLHLQTVTGQIATSRGSILTTKDQRGRIYVNGLYVTTHGSLHFGYNFNPGCITLDRDRSMVRDFDLQWETSHMWSEVAKSHNDLVMLMLEHDAPDVKHVDSASTSRLRDQAEVNFVSRHGENAVPITNETERQLWASHVGVKTVIVPAPYQSLIVGSGVYLHRARGLTKAVDQASPHEALKQFWTSRELNGQDQISEETARLWAELLERSKTWKAS